MCSVHVAVVMLGVVFCVYQTVHVSLPTLLPSHVSRGVADWKTQLKLPAKDTRIKTEVGWWALLRPSTHTFVNPNTSM